MTSFPTNHRDFYQIKMADKPDNFLKDLISSAIKEVASKIKSFESTEITKESFLASLPDDSFYYLKAISGNGEIQRALFDRRYNERKSGAVDIRQRRHQQAAMCCKTTIDANTTLATGVQVKIHSRNCP